MKIIAITQARYGSTRLPGKILKTVKGKTLLEIHLLRILQAKQVSKLKMATTIENGADEIVAIGQKLNVESYKGSISDVLERFYYTALPENPDYVVRLTSDCPLIDPDEIDTVISACVSENVDYASNALIPTFPDGIDVEVFRFAALEKAYRQAKIKSDREHVTPYIWRNSTEKGGTLFSSFAVKNGEDFSNYRLTVDEEADFKLIEHLISTLGTDKSWQEYVTYLNRHPDLLKINAQIARNEGYQKSLNKD
jgi:spore coat polysaccharide biosynthesis protein SpsF (cytidylyltransferase family)